MKSFLKMWCLLIGLTTIVCSCTRTSDEIRYCVQNQLAEKIEIHYGYSEIEYSRWCDCAYLILHEHMDTIPAQQTHRLLIPQKFHDAPENTFDFFYARTLQGDTLLNWQHSHHLKDSTDFNWTLTDSTEIINNYHTHFIHSWTLEIK